MAVHRSECEGSAGRVRAGIRNQNVCCKAMLDAMLEGDGFIVEPKNKSKCAASLTIRYYVDNLSPERRKYAEVNQ